MRATATGLTAFGQTPEQVTEALKARLATQTRRVTELEALLGRVALTVNRLHSHEERAVKAVRDDVFRILEGK